MRAAFYSVLREALFPGDGDIDALLRTLNTLGIHDEMARVVAASVDQDFALTGLSQHMITVLQDVMTNTHFYVEGIADPCRTRRGTRPGDPIGNILFNMVMSCILRDVKATMLACTDLTWFGDPTPCADYMESQPLPAAGYFDVSFVDDCAFGIHGARPTSKSKTASKPLSKP